MTAYLVADLDVKDPEELRKYAERVPATIAKYGGRYLARRTRIEVFEGSWKPKLLTIVEFPSWEAAMKWYNSPEYRPLKEMRRRAAPTNLLLVDGGAPTT